MRNKSWAADVALLQNNKIDSGAQLTILQVLTAMESVSVFLALSARYYMYSSLFLVAL